MGDIIFYIFNEMIFHSEKSRALEISTSNHNMALGLKIKETKNGGILSFSFMIPTIQQLIYEQSLTNLT